VSWLSISSLDTSKKYILQFLI